MARDSNSAQQLLLDASAQVVALCESAWNAPGLSMRLTFVVGQRLQRSLGRCYPERGLVRIARFALDLPTELRDEIICHEAAHLVVFERHGRSQKPHGAEWKELMRSVGLTPRVRIHLADRAPSFSASQESTRILYEHRCPVCQAARIARRRVSQWRCRNCVEVGLSGVLEISRCAAIELSV